MKQFTYLKALLGFAFRENPLLYLALMISALSVVIEVAAMAVLVPLASASSGAAVGGDVDVIGTVLSVLGFQVNIRGLLLLFIALFSCRVLSLFAGQSLIFFLSRRVYAQMTTRAFHSLLSVVPLREVERKSIGSYIALAGDEAFRASSLITNLSQLLNQAFLAVLYFLAILAFSEYVAIAVVLFLLATMVLLLNAFRASHRLGSLQVEQSRTAGSLFLDALNGLRTVRAYAAEQFVESNYNVQLRQYVWTLFSIDAISLLTRLGPALLLFISAGVYVYLAHPVSEKEDDFVALVVIGLLMMRFFPVVGQTVSIALKVVSDARAGRDVTSFLGKHCAGERATAPQQPLSPVNEISFVGVGFAHAEDKRVFDHVCFSLKRGRSYALIGPSGTGKSTLMDLLLRFYEPDFGSILVDGVDIKTFDERQLRRRILLVTQETTIFNDTIGNNVRFGLDATDDDVLRACRVACIDDLIAELPNGLDSMLAYRGTNLSGGQRQRIGLARALLRLPSVLILDESTSALDAKTRRQVVKHLKDEYRDKILVFVTHDESVIQSADEVLDLERVSRPESRN